MEAGELERGQAGQAAGGRYGDGSDDDGDDDDDDDDADDGDGGEVKGSGNYDDKVRSHKKKRYYLGIFPNMGGGSSQIPKLL